MCNIHQLRKSLTILKFIPKKVKESGINNIILQLKSKQQDDRLIHAVLPLPLNINGLNLSLKGRDFQNVEKNKIQLYAAHGRRTLDTETNTKVR